MLGTEPWGDYHNFNRSVTMAENECGGRTFIKPRPVFWETFFFGQNSPLREIFFNTTIQMNLERHSSQGPYHNEMIAVRSAARTVSCDDFFGFGELLAYSYYFGIQDLHKDNLLLTDSGIQVIDVEQVFSKLILPNHSLLLPLSPIVSWSAGLNILTPLKIHEVGFREARCLIDGFVNMSHFFLAHLKEILSALLSHAKNLQSQPIRIFFRGTRDYVEHLKGIRLITDLLPEEEVQLQRMDIPYFFMYLDRKVVNYYSTEDWDYKPVEVLPQFLPFVEYCAVNPLELVTQRNIEEQWARGALYLTRKLVSLNSDHLIWEHSSVFKSPQKLLFKSPNISMEAGV